jgi:hypothetical protein
MAPMNSPPQTEEFLRRVIQQNDEHAIILLDSSRKWMGTWNDGLITVGRNADDLRRIVAAFREGGGDGKPLYLQSAISIAATEQEAIEQAHRRWPKCTLWGRTNQRSADAMGVRCGNDWCAARRGRRAFVHIR